MQCSAVWCSQRTRGFICSLAGPVGWNFVDSKRKANGVAEFAVLGVWCATISDFRFRSMVRERLIDVEKVTL
jgi:hypothetical protein